MGKRFYTDQERYDACRRFKISGMSRLEFAKQENIPESTLRDWNRAYNNLTGNFINVTTALEKDEDILTDQDVRATMLTEPEKLKKSTHFSRFDHSIVVIEYQQLKITADVQTAEKLLEGLYAKIL